jgi:hypothetical protein
VSDFDLDRLGSLWRTEPEAEEMRELKRSADLARRKARWLMILDYALAGVTIGAVLLILAVNPKPEALLVGGAAVFVMITSLLRRRRLRRFELQGLVGDTESMLESSIVRIEATVKRAKSGLMVIGPSIFLGLLFGFIVDKGGGGAALPTIEGDAWRGVVVRGLFIFIVVATIAQLVLSIRRSRAELNRLIRLREAFRQEHEGSRPDSPENDG